MTEKVGARLKEIRNLLGLSAVDVSYEIDYSENTVWHIERAKTKPSFDFVARICKVYGISMDALVLSDSDFAKVLKGLEVKRQLALQEQEFLRNQLTIDEIA